VDAQQLGTQLEALASWESLQNEDRVLEQVGRGQPPSRAELSRQERAAMDRYLAGWRGWFDRHIEQDASPDRGD
jgi:hypothetical protein